MKPPRFWSAEGAEGSIWPLLLSPLSALYAWGARRRIRRLADGFKPDCPVICVGNLVAGGAGKTPVCLSLGRKFRDQGLSPHFLSRGYGGSLAGPVRVDPAQHSHAQVGDEPLLLAEVAPTWVARDRAAGARAAVEAGAGVIIMDDGFQNPSLVKTLSLLVVDGGYGFGNGRVIPAGPLREPVTEGLARADAVIRIGEGDLPQLSDLETPLLSARIEADSSDGIAGQKLLAFAGIGRPEKFYDSLRRAGGELADSVSFPDHHPYGDADLDRLASRAADLGAILVTTAKDLTRIPVDKRQSVRVFSVHLDWQDTDLLNETLAKAFRNG